MILLSAAIVGMSFACTSSDGGPADGHKRIQISTNLTKGDGGTCPEVPRGGLQARNGQCLFAGPTGGSTTTGGACTGENLCEPICCVCPSGSKSISFATNACGPGDGGCPNLQAACDVLASDGDCNE